MKCRIGDCQNIIKHDRPGRNPNNPKRQQLCDICLETVKPALGEKRSLAGLIHDIINRAKKRGKYEVTITPQDVFDVWPLDNRCPVLGYVLTRGEPRYDSPSLDRIVNTEGYVPGNIQIVSDLANKMKQNATPQELRRFCKYYGQDDSAASSQGCS